MTATLARKITYWLLSTALWMFVNIMTALGIVTSAFICLGNVTWQGFLGEAANLAAHYFDASVAQRANFEDLVWWIVVIAFLVLCWARAGTLRRVFTQSLEGRNGDD